MVVPNKNAKVIEDFVNNGNTKEIKIKQIKNILTNLLIFLNAIIL